MELKHNNEPQPIETTSAAIAANPMLGAVCPMLKLECQTCGTAYEKPIDYEKWNKEHPNVFFRWSLTYCDKCRREKEIKALKDLPKVIEALSKRIP